MIIDRAFDLLKEAVSELARLRDAVGGPTSFLARLYASALEKGPAASEWTLSS